MVDHYLGRDDSFSSNDWGRWSERSSVLHLAIVLKCSHLALWYALCFKSSHLQLLTVFSRHVMEIVVHLERVRLTQTIFQSVLLTHRQTVFSFKFLINKLSCAVLLLIV